MKKPVVKWGDVVSVVVLFALLACYITFFRTAEVDGTSMVPTYASKDFLLLYRTDDVKAGDIIALRSESLGKALCKRVIGVAGDHVVIDDTGLYINDVLQVESYVYAQDWYFYSVKIDWVVGEDEVFVLGDNRNVSTDSRYFGCVGTEDIIGVSVFNVTQTLHIRRRGLIVGVIALWVVAFAISSASKILKLSESAKTDVSSTEHHDDDTSFTNFRQGGSGNAKG